MNLKDMNLEEGDNFNNVPKVIEHFGLNIELNQTQDKIIFIGFI